MAVRIDLLDQIARRVSNYHVRPEVVYDYANIRQRLIFEALTQGVQYVCNNPVPGDVAEFGTGLGFSTFSIAKALGAYHEIFADRLRGAPPKKLYLFDSFEGLPAATDPVDAGSPTVKSGRWGAGVYKGLTAEEVAELCASVYDRAQVKVVPGWFSRTLRQIPPMTQFAMVHLDCDLYASTAEVLDYLFGQKLVGDGCALFFDDWNCNRSSPRFGQRRAWQETVGKYNLEYSDCGDYAVLSHKFIVHTDR
ncbi:MAG TPA: TylF/MycF/NovP-related O-methyltransferase [Burkholderiales bacterium]|nr:TylF/MycF/NovP-related O-methyltransferase [Burkholderiales bacterium]